MLIFHVTKQRVVIGWRPADVLWQRAYRRRSARIRADRRAVWMLLKTFKILACANGRVVQYRTCDRGVTASRVWTSPAATVHQRQLSVPSLRGRLMGTSERWRTNGHTTRCTSPESVVSQLRLLSGWGLMKHSAVLWAHEARQRLYLF